MTTLLPAVCGALVVAGIIGMVYALRPAPPKPPRPARNLTPFGRFGAHFAHQAPHDPYHLPRDWRNRHVGAYDQGSRRSRNGRGRCRAN